MILKFIKISSKDELIYLQEDFLDQKGHLTKKGAENFLGILSTLLLNYTSEKEPEWLLERFNLVLEARLSITSSFRIYMMSLLNHKLDKEQKKILIDGLTETPFGENFILDESLHNWIEENIIEEISFYRNLELGKLLIKDASKFVSFTSTVGMKSSKEILSKIPDTNFDQKIIEILQKRIPAETKSAISMKTFLFDCLKYSYNPNRFPEVLILNFSLEVKQHLFFYEKSFSIMREHYKGIVQELYNEFGKDKKNDKGLNR